MKFSPLLKVFFISLILILVSFSVYVIYIISQLDNLNPSHPITNISNGGDIPSPRKNIEPTKGGKSAKSGCKIGGCSGELCFEQGQERASICLYREEYACYKNAKCERQTDGKCAWTQTDELKSCLSNYSIDN